MNIAIISTNKDKYSETFIHNHVKLLTGNIYLLFDGYLPMKYSIDKGKTEYSFLNYNKLKWYHFFYKPKFKNTKEQLINAIQNYLQDNKIDVILCEYGPSGVEMMDIAQLLSIPFIVHFHGYDAYRKDILNSYGKHYKKMFQTCSSAVVVSNHMANQLKNIGCPQEKIKLITYGIDTEIFEKKSIDTNENIFVACGRFVEKKAPKNTIKAFELVLKKNQQVKLVMIGDGELLDDCKKLASQLNIVEYIEFKGSQTQKQIAEAFNKATAFVQHSITTNENDMEGTPLTIMEAMCAGLPIISTKHSGIVDIVKDSETGFLVNEGDIEAMSERMLYLITNKLKAKELGEKGSEIVNKKYNLQQYTKSLLEILKE